jgi:hypothetical protein
MWYRDSSGCSILHFLRSSSISRREQTGKRIAGSPIAGGPIADQPISGRSIDNRASDTQRSAYRRYKRDSGTTTFLYEVRKGDRSWWPILHFLRNGGGSEERAAQPNSGQPNAGEPIGDRGTSNAADGIKLGAT